MSFINCAGRTAPDNLPEIFPEPQRVMVGNFEAGLGKDTSLCLRRDISDE